MHPKELVFYCIEHFILYILSRHWVVGSKMWLQAQISKRYVFKEIEKYMKINIQNYLNLDYNTYEA